METEPAVSGSESYSSEDSVSEDFSGDAPEGRLCAPPIATPLDDNVLWGSGKINIDSLKRHLYGEGRLTDAQLFWLIERAFSVFCLEENLIILDAPATVCGDIHGQFYDLLRLLELGGDPGVTNYLFLGDYVDRGMFSMECVILLFAHKINFPDKFFMLRGNHECRHLTSYFSFKDECLHKYNVEIYDAIMDAFDALPLAAVLNGQFFCVHGGLSPKIKRLEDIFHINRFIEPPSFGPMCDLLWSDPNPDFECEESYKVNEPRGCSYYYSYKAVMEFLERNELLSLIRAHEAQDSGFSLMKTNPSSNFPSVITIFSAPNYLGTYNNKGAIFKYSNNAIDIKQFLKSPHPFVLPNWENGITWSIRFLCEKVGELIAALMFETDSDEGLSSSSEDPEKVNQAVIDEEKRAATRVKILAVAKMLKMLKVARENNKPLPVNKFLNPKTFAATEPLPIPSTIREYVRLEKRPDGIEKTIEAASAPIQEGPEGSTPTAAQKAKQRKKEIAESVQKLELSRSKRIQELQRLDHHKKSHPRFRQASGLFFGATI